MLRLLYRILTDLAAIPLRGWLSLRATRGKEISIRLPERRGIASHQRPPGKLAWFHGASIGESLSLLPIIEGVKRAGWQVLVTTGTVTSAKLLAERLPPGCIHQFLPLDRTAWVRRFLDHWRPDLVLWTESELWPNTMAELAARKTPAVLLNARLSDKAFRGWARWPSFARDVLAPFTHVFAQSAADAERFKELGARDVRTLGNIKLAAAPLPVDMASLEYLRAEIAGRPIWLAASIHPGEETAVAEVHRTLKEHFPGLLSLVVPRHPEKGAAMRANMTGLRATLRSETRAIARDTDIYIADTMGELGLFFRLADVAFMGKSLAVGGGQNPAEPALLGAALIVGPDMSNFRDMTAELLAANAAVRVADVASLADTVGGLLGDRETREKMAAAGRMVTARYANAVKDTLDMLQPFLRDAEIR